MIIKELRNGKGDLVVFAFENKIKEDADTLGRFVQFDQLSIFSFYMEEDIDKIFLIGIENFMKEVTVPTPTSVLKESGDHKAWNLETTLETYQELVDMGIDDNVLIKVLNTRSRAWSYWSYCFDLTNATEEDIAMILIRWEGLIYDREKD